MTQIRQKEKTASLKVILKRKSQLFYLSSHSFLRLPIYNVFHMQLLFHMLLRSIGIAPTYNFLLTLHSYIQTLRIFKHWGYSNTEDIQTLRIFKHWGYSNTEDIQTVRICKHWGYSRTQNFTHWDMPSSYPILATNLIRSYCTDTSTENLNNIQLVYKCCFDAK